MRSVKFFLLILLVLISLTSIFNTPGVNLFNQFYNSLSQDNEKNIVEWLRVFFQYPPGIFLTLNYFLSQFKVDPKIPLFDLQSVWLAVKFLLYIFYLLTYFSLLYIKKVNRKIIKMSYLDLSIVYFACIPILLTSSGLMFFEVLSAPFLVLSISSIIQRRLYAVAFFYLVSLFFNWSIFVLAPVYLLIFNKKKQPLSQKILVGFSFLLIPIFTITTLFVSKYDNPYFLSSNFLIPGSFAKLLSLPFDYIFKIGRMDNFGLLVSVVSLVTVSIGLGYLVKIALLNSLKSKILALLPYLIIPTTLSLSLFWTNSANYLLLVLFLLVYFHFTIKFSALPLTTNNIIQGIFAFYLISSLFLPDVNSGSLLTIILINLLMYIFNPSKQYFYLFFLFSLFAFINVFSNFGVTGVPSITGKYFNLFQTVFSAFFTVFIIWYLKMFSKGQSINSKNVYFLKWLIIILMLLVNLSWLPVYGSPDHISWTQYSIASIEAPNPFKAQTLVDQRYPPLSTAILGIFANGWKMFVGESENYSIATKLSVIIFYFLTVLLLIKFSKVFSEGSKLSLQDKLLAIFTTFSLIIQTQGFADLNIHLIPSLFIAIYFLFKKKYFLAGLLMGITISIKWQPMILLPLFGATFFDFKNLSESLKRSFIFAGGLFPIPIICWFLVLINPGGREAFERATDYLIHGAPMLSGQALNLNWIVTYFMHFFQYNGVESLMHLEWLNGQVATGDAPIIFQGILFLIVWFVIIIKYWLGERKDIVSFLAASLMVFFNHYQLNKSAYEKHVFYVTLLMLFIYLIRPTVLNRWLLVLFDVMTVMNLIFFYGFTGTGSLTRMFFKLDITLIFSALYLIIFLWVLYKYLREKSFLGR